MKIAIGNEISNIFTSKEIIDLIYPVGTVYTSLDSAFDPNTVWGGVWQMIESGRYLRAANGGAGTKHSESLPNITGTFASGGYNNSWNTGAFAQQQFGGDIIPATSNGSYRMVVVRNLDASRSSAVYGKSTTVQPHSVKAFVWKRTA